MSGRWSHPVVWEEGEELVFARFDEDDDGEDEEFDDFDEELDEEEDEELEDLEEDEEFDVDEYEEFEDEELYGEDEDYGSRRRRRGDWD